jgi:DNA-binding transcriptional MocR family regulator
MDNHRALIAPQFQKVLDIFDEQLARVPNVTWTRPKAGYFISLDVPKGWKPSDTQFTGQEKAQRPHCQ